MCLLLLNSSSTILPRALLDHLLLREKKETSCVVLLYEKISVLSFFDVSMKEFLVLDFFFGSTRKLDVLEDFVSLSKNSLVLCI